MIATIVDANSYALANHFNDPDAIFIEDLGITTVSTRKGLASDSFRFSLNLEVLDSLDKSFLYLCYNTPADLYIDRQLLITGFIDKISLDAKGHVSFEVSSMMKLHGSQFFTPSMTTSCQNEVYSKNCKLKPSEWSYHFQDVLIDGLTGRVSLDIDSLAKDISLGGSIRVGADLIADGNTVTLDGNTDLVDPDTSVNNGSFLRRELWWSAYVVLDGLYRSHVVNVTDDAIYLSMNFLNTKKIAHTVQVYLKCDKTYGQCFSRFQNTNNFWGFPTNGRLLGTFDIFSASELNYCGDQEAATILESCPTDSSIYGVNLHG